jgi:hypothetical protein
MLTEPAHPDVERLAQLAVEALDEVEGAVEVTGSGVLADRVRTLLPAAPAGSAERPGAIVETTGRAEAIEDAARRLQALGTLVLAWEAPEPTVVVNLYPDVHCRGLRIVGVDPDAPLSP